MTFENFQLSPWANSHPTYANSAFAVSPAPEYASSEVLVSSLYRHIGFEGVGEAQIPKFGRDLDKLIRKHRDRGTRKDGAVLDPSTFQKLVHSVLESPKLPNQSAKRFIQATPLVPAIGLVSGSARLSTNSWPAGRLIKRMIWLGSGKPEEAKLTWQRLFEALSVVSDDDVFARFLEQELLAWGPCNEWAEVDVGEGQQLDAIDSDGLLFPAKRFTKDLDAVIAIKSILTRRQWISLVEAIIRLASFAHVAWQCDIQSATWSCLRKAFQAGPVAGVDEIRREIFPQNYQFLAYGDRALPGIRDRISSYLRSRLGINAVLWCMEDIGSPISSLSSASDVHQACEAVLSRHVELGRLGLSDKIQEIFERDNRAMLCKKGIGSNMMEFSRHVLGQRQAANPKLRGYDQGYILQKSGASNSSPWIVRFGPSAVLALVHSALAGTRGMRSVHRLSQHLAGYGVDIDHNEIGNNDLGHQLRRLGLVLDSPDAESGMLLVPPFTVSDGASR